jgi:glycosyltransferase involved in cell wall biosynthesis
LQTMIYSLANQTIRPDRVMVCDNGSSDGSAESAKEALQRMGLPHQIIELARIPALGKWNINNAYWSLAEALVETGIRPDFVATIEADVTLEPLYFEKLVKCFRNDPLLGIAGGRLEPMGLLKGSYPLGKGGTMVWGANRIYSFKCWLELTNAVDLRYLPMWDTDHVVLASIRGYHVLASDITAAKASRAVSTSRGRPKGAVDAAHGLPFWWAAFKALQYRDSYYLVEFGARKMSSRGWPHRASNEDLKALNSVYNRAAVQVLRNTLRGSPA